MSDIGSSGTATRRAPESAAPAQVVIVTQPAPSSAYPRSLVERSRFLRPPKDGKKANKVTTFQWKLYDLLLHVPSGKVSTYGQLSSILSSSPRAVGSALRNNPFAPFVPCHRIIASNGYVGGFSGEWTKPTKTGKTKKESMTTKASSSVTETVQQGPKVSQKLELLASEGVKFDAKGMLKDKTCWWKGLESE